MSECQLNEAHNHSSYHRQEIEDSTECGCFHCFKTFNPTAIQHWVDGDKTAICPNCYVDAVIGDKSGYPLTLDFLLKMHTYWF